MSKDTLITILFVCLFLLTAIFMYCTHRISYDVLKIVSANEAYDQGREDIIETLSQPAEGE
jgi:hypothetical protein